MPDFNIDGENVWGALTLTDEEIIETLAQLESEMEAKVSPVPIASPAKYVPVHPPVASSKRFASLAESELAKLETDRHDGPFFVRVDIKNIEIKPNLLTLIHPGILD